LDLMLESLRSLGRFGIFAARVIFRMVTPSWEFHEAARHTWLITARCVLPVVAVVFPFGMVMALQGLQIFELFGAQRLLSSLVSVAVFRELSPVLASVLVAAQGGSAFAAELGAMRIREELDATEVMAVDPLRVHVAPRVVATLVAAPILNLIGSLSGIVGGFVVATYVMGEPAGIYWANLWELTTPIDIVGGGFKATVFGGLIGLISCYQGFYTTGGAAGVGKAVNTTVVVGVTTFMVVNYFLTSALFGAIG
jgi:phospholipid/cholesterol/gamma-HCH transport system permease protein